MAPRKPRKRIKTTKRKVTIPGQETPAQRQMRTAVRVIQDSPHYNTVLRQIRAGTPNSKIAEWAISRGFFDMNQKTLVGYLQYFRKAQPGLCKPQAPADQTLGGYDHLFDGNAVMVDEETELLRLIQLQKARLGIGFNNERNINMVLRDNRREVEELRNLLMDLAKLRGLVSSSMDVNVKGYGNSVAEDLKGIKQDEQQRAMISTLMTDLQSVVG